MPVPESSGAELTLNTQSKVFAALSRAAGKHYRLGDLFGD